MRNTKLVSYGGGSFSRSRLRSSQGRRVCTTSQVRVPAGFFHAFYERSISPKLATNRGIWFRPVRAEQVSQGQAGPSDPYTAVVIFMPSPPLCSAVSDVPQPTAVHKRLGKPRQPCSERLPLWQPRAVLRRRVRVCMPCYSITGDYS